MRTCDAIREILRQSGQTPYNAAIQIGRHNSYIYNLLNRDSDVATATLSSIARVCGYRLVLEGRGEKIEIDPAPLKTRRRAD